MRTESFLKPSDLFVWLLWARCRSLSDIRQSGNKERLKGTLVVDVTSELITQKLWKKTVWTLNVVGFIGALHCGKCRIEHSLELDLIPGNPDIWAFTAPIVTIHLSICLSHVSRLYGGVMINHQTPFKGSISGLISRAAQELQAAARLVSIQHWTAISSPSADII